MKPLLPLALLVMLAVATAPPVLGDAAIGAVNVGGYVEAGAFRAARIRLLEPGDLEVGGVYWSPVGTDQPVLPILEVLRADSGWGAGAIFAYDFHFNMPYTTAIQVTAPGLGHHETGNALTYNVQGGGWSTYFGLPAGDYVLLVATAPGDGQAEIKMRTFGASTLLGLQDGASFYDRGLDRSETAYDLFVTGNTGPLAGTHLRAWGYSGADIPFDVGGRIYGYLGYHLGQAHWVSPDGTALGDFVVDEPGGAWKASFPEESYEGPMCLPRLGCDPGFGDTREDPPFAIAADVRV